jgi:hypothetical protein
LCYYHKQKKRENHAVAYGAGYDREIFYGEGTPETPEIPETPAYTNVLDQVGAVDNVRLRGTGETQTGYDGFVSNFIPASYGAVIRVYFPDGDTSKYATGMNALARYDSDQKLIVAPSSITTADAIPTKTSKGFKTVQLFTTGLAYVRVAGVPASARSTCIVTVDEKIPQAPELD